MKRYVAIDIGGTNIKYGLIDESEVLVESHEIATEPEKGREGVLSKVEKIVTTYLETGQVDGICISSPGVIDAEKGEVSFAGPLIPNYTGTQFKKVFEEKFHIPCELENDVNCAGLAEGMSGSGKGAKVAVCLTIGTGIGGSLLVDSQVFHGASNAAFEVGYIGLKDGEFQKLAATKPLVEYVAERHGDDPAEWNGRRIFKEAEAGNAYCLEGIDRMADYLGQGIATICYVVNPEVVILGGGVMAREDVFRPKIQAALEKYLEPAIAEKTKLAFAQHQNTAGMFGAYYHFKQKHG